MTLVKLDTPDQAPTARRIGALSLQNLLLLLYLLLFVLRGYPITITSQPCSAYPGA